MDGTAVTKLDAQVFSADVRSWKRRMHTGRLAWSAASHSASAIVIIFSAISAAAGKIDASSPLHTYLTSDVATVLSIVVTIVAAIKTSFGFERNWLANRHTDVALSSFSRHHSDLNDAALADFDQIVAKHEEMMT